METALIFMSGSVAAVGAFLAPMCMHQREYSSQLNGQQLNVLLGKLPGDACMTYGPHMYHRQQWTPSCSLSCNPMYCARLTATTSQSDPNRQAFEVLVYRPACVSWDAFDTRAHTDDAGASDDAAGDDATPRVQTEMMHVVITHAALEYPCWSTVKRSLLPPGVSANDPELKTAADVARAIHEARLPNGSAVVLLRGPKMTGKSSAPKLFAARHLKPNALVCEELNPTTPGHLLSAIEEIRDQHDRTAELLIIIEEATWLLMIANMRPEDAVPPSHPKLLTSVTRKDDWNTWPERAVKIPNCIVVITANFTAHDRKQFELKHAGSMLRERRITAEFVLLPGGGFRRHGTENDKETPPAIEDVMWRGSSDGSSTSDDLMQPLLI